MNSPTRSRVLVSTATAISLAALAIGAGCGGGESSDDGNQAAEMGSAATDTGTTTAVAEDGTVELNAPPDGSLEFLESEAAAPPGKVSIRFNNDSDIVHDVVVETPNGDEVLATDRVTNGSTEASANLKPGTYTYYCSITGHRSNGMEGTLTVE